MMEISAIAEASLVPQHRDRLLEAVGVIQSDAMAPVGHPLRFLAAGFNDLAIKRRELVANAVKDKLLQSQLRSCPLRFDSFYKEDVSLYARCSILSRRLYETIRDQPPDVRREVAHHYVIHTSLLITCRERHRHTEVALLTEGVGHFEAPPPSEEVVVEAEPVGRNIDSVPSLKDKTVFWETLTQDPFVLKTIGGTDLNFQRYPFLYIPQRQFFIYPDHNRG